MASIANPPPSPNKTGSRLVAGKPIDGVALRQLTMHRDDRAGFTEVFQDHWKTGLNPVQWSIVHKL